MYARRVLDLFALAGIALTAALVTFYRPGFGVAATLLGFSVLDWRDES
jgi:hypothetical protein